LVARNGVINTAGGRIAIPTICIEEESAKIVDRTKDYDVYNLSRLGIPLVEIATAADIKSPQQIKEVAEHIGMILRSTGKVKRGIGTIRQDVNVSIKGGARVEIKGAQELKLLPTLLEFEALRQLRLLEIKRELQKRKAVVEDKTVDITSVMKDSNSKLVKKTISSGGRILAIKLKGFKGLIGKELAGRRFGRELSDYARTAAGVAGAMHSDELPDYGITDSDVAKINKKMRCGSSDAFIFVADTEEKAHIALKVIAARAKIALKEVPEEVRKANPDGTTSFLRPMPGSARMYPETDITAIKPDTATIEIPELAINKIERYSKLGLGKDLAAALVNDEKDMLFDTITKRNKNVSVPFVAEILVSYNKELIRLNAGLDPSKVKDEHIIEVFSALNNGKIAKEAVKEILADIARTGKLNLEKYAVLNDNELKKELEKIVTANKGLPVNAMIGKAMAKLRGKAEGRKIVEMLKKLAK
jgi:glutamyl-tRNA(Gln) amidotransferase subunit E